MDMRKLKQVPVSEALSMGKGCRIVAGARQLEKAFRREKVRCVLLAENADPAITRPILELCAGKGVPCAWIPSMRALGSICGIDVGAAAAADIE